MNLPKALVLTVAATTFCLMTSPAFAVEETTPQNMTCQEFMDMNPKSMTPVAFWVVNRNTDFSAATMLTGMKSRPFRYRKCCRSATRTPPLNLAISARSSKNNPPGIRPGKPAALRRVPLYSSIPHSHGRWRPISLRYKNAPIIAPTTGASSGTRK
ncbi:acid-resistance protein [Klebsiella pneumoniae]|nr:acid-resistance protein [Klebsiella pneumoniae]